MPESEQQDRTLSELVVKEAVGMGLDSSMRESILEAVDEADGSQDQRSLAVAAGTFGLGAALGFLAGRESTSLEETPLSDVDEPDMIEDVMESDDEAEGAVEETTETVEEVTDSDDEATDEGGSSGIMRLVLLVAAVAGVAYLRRRFASDEEEWEPIEEFEPATDLAEKAEDELEDVAEVADEAETGDADEETDAEADEPEDEDEDEADAADDDEDDE
ncbi:uncharacterized protein Nmag_0040 [Natrialba magadii ATCC 43099]|uniref:MYXO-CTERM domain-containing protein n=1 Tax=Natrialba magadii (strain ATCC 43099 / DSM 3394 / CCM 3739 / CIP 104546 / IAM 13178 / JCM 8861 / NBRC 102185 / NCIMB 2190 / MS3) TaxID=547559 RepID=D3SVS0_NATMM|nr:hypothetical protein [Natrialba magadii]ADD03639.1 uncharacterized protein Nmag_0040 [Natrialba magadii ATCC 43099]ELY34406.1 hypothetical protein C500_00687 [Natrialba magadii ATCC 43099]